MDAEIFIAGSGGQGVLSLGRILVEAAARENRYATYYPSYGAEIRGGTANCMIKVSDTFIHSPVIASPTDMIVMNLPSLMKFTVRYPPRRVLFVNATLVDDAAVTAPPVADVLRRVRVVRVPATATAEQAGSVRTANVVMLGALLAVLPIVGVASVEQVIAGTFTGSLSAMNISAFRAGYAVVRAHTAAVATGGAADGGAIP